MEWEWDDWADFSGDGKNWAHPGIAVTREGEIVTGHPDGSTLLVLTSGGALIRSVATELTELHGLRAVDGSLWAADIGSHWRLDGSDIERIERPDGGRVVELDPGGLVTRELERPDHPAYRDAPYKPTAVDVDDDGTIWVADGYGAELVHRYAPDGTHSATLTGEDGAGRFDTPHDVFVDRRRGEPELYVADRGNGRIQVFGLDGDFKRLVGEEVFTAPTVLATWNDYLIVTDFMRARVTVLDADDRLVSHLYENRAAPSRPKWPNAGADDGTLLRPQLESGKFNSPHAVAADSSGNLYVTEWLAGGRYTKLKPR